MPENAPLHDLAVLIGRLQPVHNAHVALLRHALAHAQQTVVILGSAFQARTTKNPFTWQERERMLRDTLSPEDNARLHVVPIRDYYDEPRWVRSVQEGVRNVAPYAQNIALIGHFKDASSSYLMRFPNWHLLDMPRLGAIDATPIRDAYWQAPPSDDLCLALQPWCEHLPDSTQRFLAQFAHTPDCARLREERAYLRDYQAAWSTAPYAPTFVTVDALVLCQGHVLLVERGHAPGKGLWALPGGFLEQRDTLWQSCLRELEEETGLQLPAEQWRAALCGVEVFDYPHRSERGRTVTHVHLIDLSDDVPLPVVVGGDDTAAAMWCPLTELPAREDTFFEDHFHVLRRSFEQRRHQLRTTVPALA